MLCCQLLRTAPLSKYTERGSIRATRRSQFSPTFRRSRSTHGARNDTATMFSKVGRSRCLPIPAPGAYSVTISCSNPSAGVPLIWPAISVNRRRYSGMLGSARGSWPAKIYLWTKAVNPPVSQVAVKFEWFEWQRFKSLYQVLLFHRRESFRHVTKASRQVRMTKQIAHASICWRS
jgi:hypothetical protein